MDAHNSSAKADSRSASSSAAQSPLQAPDTGANLSPLSPGDSIQSLHAGRTGFVVKVYADGSACICWDDGEPQETGLGHERVPRNLLVRVEEVKVKKVKTPKKAKTPASTGPALPPDTAPVFGATAGAAPNSGESQDEASAYYPAVYTLLPGEFEGAAYSILAYEGRTWIIAEELAALLGDTPQAVTELEEIIGSAFDAGFPENSYAKVRLASTVLTARILDQSAVGYICATLYTATALRFAAVFCAKSVDMTQSPLPTFPLPGKPLPEAITLLLEDMAERERDIWKMVNRVHHQVKAMALLAFEVAYGKDAEKFVYQLGAMAELADVSLEPFEDITERMEDIRGALKVQMAEALTPPARQGAPLPAEVWGDLVGELSAGREKYGNEDMWRLCKIAQKLRIHAEATPEAGAALEALNGFMRRQGAYLYPREGYGIAWDWNPGHGPQQARERAAREAAMASH